MNTWRYIPPIHAPGAIQMAIDSWLLEQHRQGNHPPTLRFYTWSPPAISLGYHQRRYPEFWENLVWQGQSIDLVRRPSGGRAVLHQGDLTYAVITSGLAGNRMQSYQKICEFLIQGWQAIGISLQYGAAGRGYIHNPNCFGTATGADLVMTDGSKLIGSAQLRRGNAILQHGSMVLNPDPALFHQAFGVEQKSPVLPLTSSQAGMEVLMSTLKDAARSCFDIDWLIQPLSASELRLGIAEMALDFYGFDKVQGILLDNQ
ncbi:lipoate--protein ligase family protein [Egbenema bharatensis]|uniref:lipoate--protein ligase family protein n=1 Tax=Egbenema bharatensis TaxID=3463334 RepID=UPI003A88BC48